MRVAVLGDIGQPVHHVGDEAMTHAVGHALVARGHTPVLLTRSREHTRAAFGSRAECAPTLVFPWPPVDRERYLGEIREVLAGDLGALPAEDQIHAFLDLLRSCDALVIAGGGNLNSRYGWLMYERIAALEAAHALGLPSVVAGQTLGPALSRPDVAALAAGLDRALAVGARESRSHVLTTRLLGPERVHRVLDDASFLADVPLPAGAGAPAGAREVPDPSDRSSEGAIVVTLGHGSLGAHQEGLGEVAAALDALAERSGLPVHLVPHMGTPGAGDGDVELHTALAAAMTASALVLDLEHTLVAARRGREAALVLTTRYHPAVFALEGAVPVLPVSPDGYSTVRLAGALENWGIGPDAVVALGRIVAEPGLLRERLLTLWEGRERVAEELRARRPALRAHAEQTWETLLGALEQGTVSAGPPLDLPPAPPWQLPGATEHPAAAAEPDVSIVLRTKDRAPMLARALDDVAAQTHPSYELIVVNDGGDPGTVDELVGSCVGLERVRVLHRETSTGMEAASNAGLALARGTYVAIHDDDDTWAGDLLALAVAHLNAHPDQQAVAGRTEIVWERLVDGVDRPVEEGREAFEPGLRMITYADLLRYNRMVPISCVFRRDVLGRIGSFDESLTAVGDWEFNLRLAALGPVTVLPGPALAFWHQRRGSTGALGNSVIVDLDSHLDLDLRVRDERLRAHVAAHGDGDLLYLTRFLHERHLEVTGELRAVEQRLTELEGRLLGTLEALEHATREAGVVGLARRKYWAARHRAAALLRARR